MRERSPYRCSWAPPFVPVARISATRIRDEGNASARRTSAAHGSKLASNPDGPNISVAGTTDQQSVDGFVDRAPVVLVRLVAAKEVDSPAAKRDGRLHVIGD